MYMYGKEGLMPNKLKSMSSSCRYAFVEEYQRLAFTGVTAQMLVTP